MCLESNPFAVQSDFVSGVKSILNPASTSVSFMDGCSNQKYEKLKFIKSETTEKYYLSDYEAELFEDKFLLEFVLVLDPFKSIFQRESVSFLDYLGDLGGFYGAIDILIFMIGEFFSAKLFMASIAGSFYTRKLLDEEKKKVRNNSKSFSEDNSMSQAHMVIDEPKLDFYGIANQFSDIKISFFNVMIDPILACVLRPCKSCNRTSGYNIRSKMLERCEDKYANELEVTNLINKLRDTYGMTHGLRSKEQRDLLRYTKDRVIDLESHSSSCSSSSEGDFSKTLDMTP